MRKRVRNRKKEVSRNKIPLGVMILSILGYIGSIIFFVFGILGVLVVFYFAVSPPGFSITPDMLPPDFPQAWFDTISKFFMPALIFISVFFVIVGVIGYLISRGLWQGKNWARIVMIVLSIFSAFSDIMNLIVGDFGALVSLIINILIIGYLSYNKEVKKFFR